MTDRLTPEREAEIAAAVAELDADRMLAAGCWTASPVDEKSMLPPELAFAVEDVVRMESATIRGSVGVFGDERHAAFAALARTAVSELLAELAAVRAELAARTEHIDFLERNTLPELRRTVQHHIDGKQRWRARAEKAEARVSAVLDLCDREQRNAMRFENPIPVPEWVAPVQKLALGDAKSAEEAAS